MHDDVHDLEEVVLFPDFSAPAAEDGPRSSDELLAITGDAPLVALREWLTIQLTHVDGQMRKQSGPSKPADITPEVAAYIQGREAQVSRKAAKDAYMKTLHKLDHFMHSP